MQKVNMNKLKKSVDYDLLDMFLQDLAAGSVDGTTATDGRNVRTVVDTENALSVSNGELVYSDGTSDGSINDPAIWYPAIIRKSGIIQIGRLKPITYNGNYVNSFLVLNIANSGNTPSSGSHWIYTNSTNLKIRMNNVSQSVGGALVVDTEYFMAMVVLSTGCLYFIKGGIYANWTYLGKDVQGNNATLYPNIGGQVGSVFSSGFLAIPSQRWLPSPLFYHDPTNEADGALTVSNGYGGDNGLGAGGGGVAISGGAVSSGKIVVTPTLGDELITNGDFSAWTGDNPDGWTYVNGDANNYVENVDDECHLVSNGSFFGIKQVGVAEVGQRYLISVDITVADPLARYLRIDLWNNAEAKRFNTVGTHRFVVTANDTDLYITRYSLATDITFDNVSVKELTFADLLIKPLQSITPDVIFTVPLTLPDAYMQGGICLRVDDLDDPQNYILVYADRKAAKISVYKVEDGVYTALQTDQSFTYVEDAELVASISGTSLSVFYNNALVGAAMTVPASTDKYHALFATDDSIGFGVARAYAVGSEGQHSILDKFIPAGK